MMLARVVEYDAAGLRVRPMPGEDPTIVLGEYELILRSKDEAQALIDAIWRSGRVTGWTLVKPSAE